jgi:hypothetical protein
MRIHDYVSLNKVLNKKIEGYGVGHSCLLTRNLNGSLELGALLGHPGILHDTH